MVKKNQKNVVKKTKTETKPEAKAPSKAPEKKPKEKKKVGKIVGIILGVVVVLAGALVGAKLILGRTTTETLTVELPDDTRSFSGFFKEYLADRVKAENLMAYKFREEGTAEILEELTALKDGFSKVSRGMNGFDEESEFYELAKIMKSDANAYLTLVRELRAIETGEYADEADRQVAFMKAVETRGEELRSRLYVSRSAYEEGKSGLSTEAILIFEGSAMVEVGGGVMNLFLGDTTENLTAVVNRDFTEGVVQTVEGGKLYGYTNARLVKFGERVKDLLELGKLVDVKITLKTGEAEIWKRKLSLIGETTWSLEKTLEKEGIRGVVGESKGSMSQTLTEAEAAIRGKNKTGEE